MYSNTIALSDETVEYTIRALKLAVYTAKKNPQAWDTIEQFEGALAVFEEFKESQK